MEEKKDTTLAVETQLVVEETKVEEQPKDNKVYEELRKLKNEFESYKKESESKAAQQLEESQKRIQELESKLQENNVAKAFIDAEIDPQYYDKLKIAIVGKGLQITPENISVVAQEYSEYKKKPVPSGIGQVGSITNNSPIKSDDDLNRERIAELERQLKKRN